MAETSYPIAGGAGVNEFTYELLMAQALGSGRVEPVMSGSTSLSSALVYADSSGRQVKIAANAAYMMRGFRWESGPDGVVVPLNANTSGKTRKDRIVLRLDRSTYTIRVSALPGTPADVPAAPSPVVSSSLTGEFEEAIGTVTVKSQSGTGLPTITATDVVSEDKYLAPPGIYGSSAVRGSANPIGKFYLESDTKRLFWGAPGGDILVAENGPLTKLAPAGGWKDDNLYVQRVNGMTYFQGKIALNTTDRPAGTDMTVCTLPATFRPTSNFYSNVVMSPGQGGWAHFDASTGVILITSYPQAFPNGGILIIGPVTYPSVGVRTS